MVDSANEGKQGPQALGRAKKEIDMLINSTPQNAVLS